MKEDALQRLRDFGLNQLEAEVYYLLLCENLMTAYKVGKLLKKPTANIYKAVEVLCDKGAVIIEEGKNKLCKAVDPQEFIAVQEGQFAEKTRQVSKALVGLKPNIEEEKTYSLDSVDLAIQKAIKMIDEATMVVVVDAFPLALEAITERLKKAVKRGVEVVIQSYSEVDIDGADVCITQNYSKVISYWQSQQLNVIVDGHQSLIALFDESLSKVHHATWSTNVYLSCIMHAGRLCEQSIHKLMAVADADNSQAQMKAILKKQKFFGNSEVPGIKTLFERYMVKEKS